MQLLNSNHYSGCQSMAIYTAWCEHTYFCTSFHHQRKEVYTHRLDFYHSCTQHWDHRVKVYRGQELWEKREECIVRNLMRTSLEKVHGPAQKV